MLSKLLRTVVFHQGTSLCDPSSGDRACKNLISLAVPNARVFVGNSLTISRKAAQAVGEVIDKALQLVSMPLEC